MYNCNLCADTMKMYECMNECLGKTVYLSYRDYGYLFSLAHTN